MEQVNAKRVAIFVVSACLIGMVVGSAVILGVLNVQRRPFDSRSHKTVRGKNLRPLQRSSKQGRQAHCNLLWFGVQVAT